MPHGANPSEWKTICRETRKILLSKHKSKIALAAFTSKGKRKKRWLLNRSHPEYCTRDEALQVAKKLTWQMLKSRGVPTIPPELEKLLHCHDKDCKLFMGHEGACVREGDVPQEITRCHLCKETITLEDFDRNGRIDPNSLQLGHDIPLSIRPRQHNAKNSVWAHRRCNQIQSDKTLSEVIRHMSDILEAHGYKVEKK